MTLSTISNKPLIKFDPSMLNQVDPSCLKSDGKTHPLVIDALLKKIFESNDIEQEMLRFALVNYSFESFKESSQRLFELFSVTQKQYYEELNLFIPVGPLRAIIITYVLPSEKDLKENIKDPKDGWLECIHSF